MLAHFVRNLEFRILFAHSADISGCKVKKSAQQQSRTMITGEKYVCAAFEVIIDSMV